MARSSVKTIQKVDPVWARVRAEAEDIVQREQALAPFIFSAVLHHETLEASVVYRLTERLDHHDVPAELIRQAYGDALEDDPTIGEAFRADIVATVDRDPAVDRCIEPVLYFKGFHAIQTHRLAHWLWRKGRKDFAYYLQSRSSSEFQCDIHPAAKIGRGIFLDHATGLVVGETAVIGERVRLYQAVTLGARSFPADETGALIKGRPRHPIIEDDVVIYAGATVLGRITIGRGSTIGGNVWLTQSVPPHSNVSQALSRQS